MIIENLEDKDPVNFFGNNPLHLAAERGHLDICRLLVKSGVNKETQNHAGEIPLNLATINDNLRVGVFLISNMDHVQLFFNNLNKEIIYFLKIILLWLLDWIILTLGSGILYYCCFSIASYDWKFFPIPSFAFSIFWVSLIHIREDDTNRKAVMVILCYYLLIFLILMIYTKLCGREEYFYDYLKRL